MTKTLGSKLVDTLDGNDFRTITEGIARFDARAGLGMEASLEEILTADSIVVIGANPIKSHPVVGSYILRATAKNKSNLVVIDPLRNPFTFRATVWLRPPEGKKALAVKAIGKAIVEHGLPKSAGDKSKFSVNFKDTDIKKAAKDLDIDVHDINRAAEVLAESKNGIIIYGDGVLQYKDADIVALILNLAALINTQPKVISLKRYGNSRGAWDAGLGNPDNTVAAELNKGKVKGAYLLLADDPAESQALADSLGSVEFVVAQASYLSPVTALASVVLPSLHWTESKGTYTTIDGILKSTAPIVKVSEDILTDADTIKEIASRLKK